MTPREKSLAKTGAIATTIVFVLAFYRFATTGGGVDENARVIVGGVQMILGDRAEPIDEIEEEDERLTRCSLFDDGGEPVELPAIEWPSVRGCYVMRARWAPAHDVVAVQIASRGREAALFTADGTLFWAPEGAIEIAWGTDDTLLVLRDRAPDAAVRVVVLERYRWPSRERIDAVEVSSDMIHSLVISPDGAHAALTWGSLFRSGWLVVDLGEVLSRRETRMTNRDKSFAGAPVFSPNGAMLAAPATAYDWWLPPRSPRSSTTEGPSNRARRLARARAGAVGGATRVGWIWVQDLATDETRRIDVEVDLPAGWGSSIDPTVDRIPMLGAIRFVDERTVEVTLPDDTTRTIAL